MSTDEPSSRVSREVPLIPPRCPSSTGKSVGNLGSTAGRGNHATAFYTPHPRNYKSWEGLSGARFPPSNVSHNLNSLTGNYTGDDIGEYYRGYEGGYTEFRQ